MFACVASVIGEQRGKADVITSSRTFLHEVVECERAAFEVYRSRLWNHRGLPLSAILQFQQRPSKSEWIAVYHHTFHCQTCYMLEPISIVLQSTATYKTAVQTNITSREKHQMQ